MVTVFCFIITKKSNLDKEFSHSPQNELMFLYVKMVNGMGILINQSVVQKIIYLLYLIKVMKIKTCIKTSKGWYNYTSLFNIHVCHTIYL